MPGTPALLGQDRGAGCYLHSLGCRGSKEDSGDAGNGQSLTSTDPQEQRAQSRKNLPPLHQAAQEDCRPHTPSAPVLLHPAEAAHPHPIAQG